MVPTLDDAPASRTLQFNRRRGTMARTGGTDQATTKRTAGRRAGRITPAKRQRMIAEAAYYRAERRGFAPGEALHDWLEAENDIDRCR
jgi:hypothetical protein